MRNFSLFAVLFLFILTTRAQEDCIGAEATVTINGYYSTYDGFYQQCVGESIFLSCESIVLPENATVASIQWMLGEVAIPDANQSSLEFNSYTSILNDITVEVQSSQGCIATFALDMPIVYLEAPEINLDQSVGTCLSLGAPVEVSFDLSQNYNFVSVNEQVPLPDNSLAYEGSIFIDGYDNQTIENCTDLSSVFMNIEHSYFGDLVV